MSVFVYGALRSYVYHISVAFAKVHYQQEEQDNQLFILSISLRTEKEKFCACLNIVCMYACVCVGVCVCGV